MYTQIQLLFIGSKHVGKTSIIHTLAYGKFPNDEMIPMVTCTRASYYFDNVNYNFAIFEANSYKDNDYKKLRSASDYLNADIIGLCFSLINRESFDDCYNYWYNELKEFKPNTPVILISTKSDLIHPQQPITQKEISEMVQKINAIDYIETSSKNNSTSLFKIIKRSYTQLYKNKSNKCILT